MTKKILILYTSVGLGHKSIAENIGYHLAAVGYDVKLHDVLQEQTGVAVKIWVIIQQIINRRLPFIWKWLYIHSHRGWFSDLTLSSRVKAASRNYRDIKQVVDDFQPDLVIATQTTASAVMQYLKQQGWYKSLFAIAFSDYHLHRYWLYDDADFYLANIPEQKQEMIQLGIPPEKIYVAGITLRPRPAVDTSAVRNKLGIALDEKVVLVASGSLGYGLPIAQVIKLAGAIAQLPNTKLIIVCGKNEDLKKQLDQKIKSNQVLVRGYYSPLAELYAISDIFLTKPGGLTVAETLQWHLPMLITHWLPGEAINYRYLAEKRLVITKPQSVEPLQIMPLIQEELAQHSFRQSLISNPAAVELTQANREGSALVQAVRAAFHEV